MFIFVGSTRPIQWLQIAGAWSSSLGLLHSTGNPNPKPMQELHQTVLRPTAASELNAVPSKTNQSQVRMISEWVEGCFLWMLWVRFLAPPTNIKLGYAWASPPNGTEGSVLFPFEAPFSHRLRMHTVSHPSNKNRKAKTWTLRTKAKQA